MSGIERNQVGRHVCAENCKHDAHFAGLAIDDVRIPDSKMAKDLTHLIRDLETDLLFNHSTRVYFFGALTGKRRGSFSTSLRCSTTWA
jgi:hypothetical protein